MSAAATRQGQPEGRRGNLVPVEQVVAQLAASAPALCLELLPAGKRQGAEWRVGSIAGEPGQSLGVRLFGAKAGVWQDFASADRSHRGDALDLVAAVLFGGDKREALRWARAWLGLDSGGAPFRTRQAPRPASRETAERDEEGRRLKARALWLGAQPIEGTPAAEYLAGRGLRLEALPRIPGALRFHPATWCQEVRGPLPAMLAAIVRGGAIVACHRTYLAPRPGGGWGKAKLANAKKVLGAFGGGVIALHRGASGKPLREAPEGDVAAIAEGIEDALTVALHSPEWRCLAAVSLGNMGSVELPEAVGEVVLVFDRDGENAQARAARARAERWFLEQGRAVRAVKPPEGFKDMNAWHQAMGEA
jgi:hypothetical protein